MARTLSLLSLLGIALLTLAACASEDSRSSSNDEDDGDGGDATTTAASSGSAASSATGTGGEGGSNTGGAGAGGDGGEGGAGGAGGESGNGIGMPTLGSWQGGVNCMPIVPPDPVSGSFNIGYDNTQGTSEGFVMLSNVSLLLEKNGMNLLWPFDVTPPSSGPVPAGKSVDITHKKVTGSGAGTGSPCDFCGGSWTLFVTAEVGSDGHALSTGPTPVECVY